MYLKVFQLSYFASECLFQQAFYLKIALALAIDHSTAALPSRLYSYNKESNAKPAYGQVSREINSAIPCLTNSHVTFVWCRVASDI